MKECEELLLIDLCGRLHYGVKILHKDQEGKEVITKLVGYNGEWFNYYIDNLCYHLKLDEFKPYLRSMSSMTEEESNEFESITFPLMKKDWDGNENPACIRCIDIPKYMNFILSHHFDYQGLIEKDLAFEAPEGMYNIKEQ